MAEKVRRRHVVFTTCVAPFAPKSGTTTVLSGEEVSSVDPGTPLVYETDMLTNQLRWLKGGECRGIGISKLRCELHEPSFAAIRPSKRACEFNNSMGATKCWNSCFQILTTLDHEVCVDHLQVAFIGGLGSGPH